MAGSACRRCSCTAGGSLGRARDRAPHSTSACCSRVPSCPRRASSSGWSPAGVTPAPSIPSLVASYPVGDSWPPAPDLRQAHRHTRRVRRVSAAAILLAGIVDLLASVTPPLRARLHLILDYLPLRASVAAGAVIAVAGIGPDRARPGDPPGPATRLAGGGRPPLAHDRAPPGRRGRPRGVVARHRGRLSLLLTNRKEFQAASDSASLRSALVMLVVGHRRDHRVHHRVDRDLHPLRPRTTPAHRVVDGAGRRCPSGSSGSRSVALPDRLEPLPRPEPARRRARAGGARPLPAHPAGGRPPATSGRAAEFRARDIVRRHGEGTLDYFALRATSSGSSTATAWSPTPSTAASASSPPTRSGPATSASRCGVRSAASPTTAAGSPP